MATRGPKFIVWTENDNTKHLEFKINRFYYSLSYIWQLNKVAPAVTYITL